MLFIFTEGVYTYRKGVYTYEVAYLLAWQPVHGSHARPFRGLPFILGEFPLMIRILRTFGRCTLDIATHAARHHGKARTE